MQFLDYSVVYVTVSFVLWYNCRFSGLIVDILTWTVVASYLFKNFIHWSFVVLPSASYLSIFWSTVWVLSLWFFKTSKGSIVLKILKLQQGIYLELSLLVSIYVVNIILIIFLIMYFYYGFSSCLFTNNMDHIIMNGDE